MKEHIPTAQHSKEIRQRIGGLPLVSAAEVPDLRSNTGSAMHAASRVAAGIFEGNGGSGASPLPIPAKLL